MECFRGIAWPSPSSCFHHTRIPVLDDIPDAEWEPRTLPHSLLIVNSTSPSFLPFLLSCFTIIRFTFTVTTPRRVASIRWCLNTLTVLATVAFNLESIAIMIPPRIVCALSLIACSVSEFLSFGHAKPLPWSEKGTPREVSATLGVGFDLTADYG